MIKTFVSTLTAGLITLTLTACVYAAQDANSSRKMGMAAQRVQTFAKIDNLDLGDLHFTYTPKDTTPTVYVDAVADIMPFIKLKHEDGKVLIYLYTEGKKVDKKSLKDVRVRIISPTIRQAEVSTGATLYCTAPLKAAGDLSLEASSGARISLLGGLTCGELTADCSSGGSLTLHKVNCQTVEADVSSGGMITLKGKCAKAVFDASSGAALHADNLTAETVSAEASSGASITCKPTKSIDYANGSGGRVKFDARGVKVTKR